MFKGDESLGDEANKMLEQWKEAALQLESRKENLNGEDLSNLKLMEIDLSNASLVEADLSSTYLIKANLSGADLTEADLTGAILAEADLKGANFQETELMDSYLNGADLSGAVNLTRDQIEIAHIDRDTRLPDYLSITWNGDNSYSFTG